MNRSVWRILILIAIFSASLRAEEVWKVASLNWEPYSGETLDGQGTSIEKLRQILARGGISLVVEFYPWPRAQHLAGTGEFFGYFPAWPEEVYPGFLPSDVVDQSYVALLIKKGRRVIYSSLEELFGRYRIGVVESYTYPEDVEAQIQLHPQNVDPSPDEEVLMKKLSRERIDVAITDPFVMEYYALKEGLSDIETLEIFGQKELLVAVWNNAANREKLRRLNELLK